MLLARKKLRYPGNILNIVQLETWNATQMAVGRRLLAIIFVIFGFSARKYSYHCYLWCTSMRLCYLRTRNVEFKIYAENIWLIPYLHSPLPLFTISWKLSWRQFSMVHIYVSSNSNDGNKLWAHVSKGQWESVIK